jgi:hypothetical protein
MENQGKTPKQISDSVQNWAIALIALAFISLLIAILQ